MTGSCETVGYVCLIALVLAHVVVKSLSYRRHSNVSDVNCQELSDVFVKNSYGETPMQAANNPPQLHITQGGKGGSNIKSLNLGRRETATSAISSVTRKRAVPSFPGLICAREADYFRLETRGVFLHTPSCFFSYNGAVGSPAIEAWTSMQPTDGSASSRREDCLLFSAKVRGVVQR
ncbi:hypothetical protein BU16DRAFT_277315 [Lophium mytilinum]|uniref:Uncharacterized protein n=1 Tax=Lophium mytilinum TaxID=390894 RepID=A0A6A6R4E6_9PEZI|nr:hypothetical protein BU16DRAFT_277315 [Lophium mytilinum]